MTMCDKIRPQLTAYLDGDLADDPGSVVRGHLRECPACRQIARDEAALRDGLRTLAPVDPPASLWAGVQAQLAAAEVADARKPRWRRQAERWARWVRAARWMPSIPQLAMAGLVAASAIAILTWRGHRADEPLASHAPVVATPRRIEPPARPAPAPPPPPIAPSDDDVTADLASEPARTTASYGRAIEELMKLATEDRARWSDDARAAFDTQITAMRDAIAHAGQARAVQRAQRSLIRYLQRSVVHDDIVLASGGTR